MKNVYYPILLIMVISLLAACGASNFDDNGLPEDDADASVPLGPFVASSFVRQPNALAPQILTSADHGAGIGWKKDKCFLCHPLAELKMAHEYSPALSASLSELDETDTGACLYCHGSNGLTGVTAASFQCMRCHADSTIVDSADMFAGHNMHDMNGDGSIGNADCIVCHAFSDMNGEISLAVDFRHGATDYADVSAFCLNCHDGNGAFGILPPELSTGTAADNIYSTYKGMGETPSVCKQTADIHGARNGPRSAAGRGDGPGSGQEDGPGSGQEDGPGSGQEDGPGSGSGSGQTFGVLRGAYAGGMEVSCLDCHQVHSSDNPYLIIQSGTSAVFADDTARAAAVAVTENNFTQLCAVCHTSPDGAPTDNGLTQVVHPGTFSAYCTDCHYHGAGANQSGLF